MATLIILLKLIAVPVLSFLTGVLFPSPLQKAIDQTGKNHDAENQASSSHGNVGGLDHLP